MPRSFSPQNPTSSPSANATQPGERQPRRKAMNAAVKRIQTDALRPDEVELVIRAADKLGRDEALLIRVLTYTGIRVAEVCALNRGDYVPGSDDMWELHIGHGKGDKPRTVYVPDTATHTMLRDWVHNADGSRRPRDGAMFTGRGQRDAATCSACAANDAASCSHVAPRTVERVLQRISNQTGVKRPSHHGPNTNGGTLWPHCLRHTFALRALRAGWSIYDVAVQLGHEDIQTTSIYLRITGTGLSNVAKHKPLTYF